MPYAYSDEVKSSSVRSVPSSVNRTGISRARQHFVISQEHKPVSDPIPKLGGGLQGMTHISAYDYQCIIVRF